MPAGCEFICDNKDCENYNTGFTIQGVWPLGNIGLIINSSNVKQNKPFQEGLIKLKGHGRKYACITLPNTDEIPILGYRFSQWCGSCNCIWPRDIFFTEEEQAEWENSAEVPEAWFDNVKLPFTCPQCEGMVKSFDTVTQDGIDCPTCKEELKQSRWFSNERDVGRESAQNAMKFPKTDAGDETDGAEEGETE